MSEGRTSDISPIELDSIITIAAPAVAAVNDSDTVLHNLETGTSYRLNDIGTRVWELIESGATTIAAIAASIRAEYALPPEIPPEQVQDDILSMLSELHQYGLVEIGRS